MTFKGHKRIFWGDRNDLYFYCDDYMSVYICQSHLTVYLKLVHFILCRLYINQLNLKIWMEKVVDTISRDWIESTTPSILETPRRKETLPLVQSKMVHT